MAVRNRYTNEYKQKAIAEAERLKSGAEAARKFGIPESTLQQWVFKYRNEKHDEQLTLQSNQKDKELCVIEDMIESMQDTYDFLEAIATDIATSIKEMEGQLFMLKNTMEAALRTKQKLEKQ